MHGTGNTERVALFVGWVGWWAALVRRSPGRVQGCPVPLLIGCSALLPLRRERQYVKSFIWMPLWPASLSLASWAVLASGLGGARVTKPLLMDSFLTSSYIGIYYDFTDY